MHPTAITDELTTISISTSAPFFSSSFYLLHSLRLVHVSRPVFQPPPLSLFPPSLSDFLLRWIYSIPEGTQAYLIIDMG